MDDIKWVKIDVNIFENPKLKELSFEKKSEKIILFWFQILILCAKVNEKGDLMMTENKPFTARTIAIQYGLDNIFVESALNRFLDLEMIDKHGDIFHVKNWAYYQNAAFMDDKKQYERERKRNQKVNRENSGKVPGKFPERSLIDVDVDVEVDVEKKQPPVSPVGKTDSSMENKPDALIGQFWNYYPKRVGYGLVEKWFAEHRPSQELVDQMIQAIKKQSSTISWTKEGGRYIPAPIKWLEGEHWKDDPEIVMPPTAQEEAAKAMRELLKTVPAPKPITSKHSEIPGNADKSEPFDLDAMTNKLANKKHDELQAALTKKPSDLEAQAEASKKRGGSQ